MDWLAAHGPVVNLIVNLGMLVVWVAYLQLFLITYLRSRKPRLIINRGSGRDIGSVILVSNMSQEPVYPQNAYCTIHHADASYSATITDREELLPTDAAERPEGVTSHGPLGRGEFMSIGTFRNILEITAAAAEGCPDELDAHADRIRSVEIMVVGAFGGDDLEIAAKREYRIDTGHDPWRVIPVGPATRQISSRRERKRIRRMITDELRQG
ncbi:hypothetical protein P1J78_00280 [Psychromarinibacter sp. C21-152]|uniref:Uncharacterized protein n=1 Tax=Psychromarinibacter sediminicola TaxID=3033385 RepID=A0AAE3T719_9RHOB|nr:hypothetical protein [Psychromarinibacter sediminicola]MDF0599153.1 hypothetical protein [Psychromarinibacter sediminicola]